MASELQELTARAKALIAERKYQEAVRVCRRALLASPDELRVRLLLGMAMLALRRYDEVRAEMLALLRTDPEEPTVHRILGESYLRSGMAEKAKESLRRALDLDPHDDIAKELMSEVVEEEVPASGTIDRWFAPDAHRTELMDNPESIEEKTGPVSAPEIDPEMLAEIEAYERTKENETPPSSPPGRPGPSTLPPPNADVPRKPTSVPPPAAGAPAGPPKAAPLPALDARPGGLPSPGALAPLRAPPPGPSAAASGPPAPRAASFPSAPPAVDGKPKPFFPSRNDSGTEELSVDEIDPVDEFSEPTMDVEQSELIEPSMDLLDDSDAGLEPLEEEPTRARTGLSERPRSPFASSPLGGSAMPPSGPYPMPPQGSPLLPAPQSPSPSVPPEEAKKDEPLPPPSIAPPSTTETTAGRHQRPTPKKKRPLSWLAIAIVPLVLITATVVAVGIWQSGDEDAQVRQRAYSAADDGLLASFNHAMSALATYNDDPELVALRARLMATVTLEYGQDRALETRNLLTQLEPDVEARLVDVRIARAYLDLAAGDVEAATGRLAGITGDGPLEVELARARAHIAHMSGDLATATREAARAAQLRPNAPRHVAFHAILMAQSPGGAAAALRALSSVPNGDDYPAVRIARARILFLSGADPARAIVDAQAILHTFAERAAPSELAWAHLLCARAAANAGNVEETLTEGGQAAALRPLSDEGFGLFAAETFLNAGRPTEARDQLEHLPPRTLDTELESRLRAEVALEMGQLDLAESALTHAGSSPRTEFLRGRLKEASGQIAEARAAYQRASGDPREAVRASARLGALDLAEGHVAEAVTVLSTAFARWAETDRPKLPGEVQVARWLVRALIASGQVDRAEQTVRTAIAVAGEVPELRAARAQVDLVRGRYGEALTALEELTHRIPDDPELLSGLGEALRQAALVDPATRAEKLERARTAFSEALRVRDGHPQALLGMGLVLVATGETDQARTFLERAEAAHVVSPELNRARAQLLVIEGKGAEGVESVRQWANEAATDPVLFVLLGRLLTEADEMPEAQVEYERALTIDPNQVDAYLGMGLGMAILNRTRLGDRSFSAVMDRAKALLDANPNADVEQRARLLAIGARASFNVIGRRATPDAERAIELDARCSEAHRVLALAEEGSRAEGTHLRAAVAGRAPLGETIARAARVESGAEQCALARRYMAMAPRGYEQDREAMAEIVARCR